MMEKEVTTTLCRFSDDVVAYLYDELAARDRDVFEAHLPGCTACTDEFAAVADTRFSVYEWHKEEFVPLATPRFARPYEIASEKVSVFAAVANLFAWSRPAFAMAGIAAVVAIGVIAFGFLRNGEQQIAANLKIAVPVTTVTTNAELPAIQPESIATVAPVTAAHKPARVAAKPRTSPRSTPKPTVDVQPGDQFRQARKAPVLGNEIDLEDDSLRLTDLFDEVGG